MTLHGAKGLEFPCVFLPGWEDGLFPSQRSMDNEGKAGLEEERRLAYVGMTRAREHLTISFAANRQMYGRWQSSMPSRFIDELPASEVEVLPPPGLYGGGYGAASPAAGPAEGSVEGSETLTGIGPDGSRRVSINLPAGPYSYQGESFSIQWGIEAIAKPSLEHDRKKFVLAPAAREEPESEDFLSSPVSAYTTGVNLLVDGAVSSRVNF